MIACCIDLLFCKWNRWNLKMKWKCKKCKHNINYLVDVFNVIYKSKYKVEVLPLFNLETKVVTDTTLKICRTP